jgi:hypothetical protein
LFIGPEGDAYREGLSGSLPAHLLLAGRAHSQVGESLAALSGGMAAAQEAVAPWAVRAPWLWRDLLAARGRVLEAAAADESRRLAALAEPGAADELASGGLPGSAGSGAAAFDGYQSDAGAASEALGAAQRAWDEAHGAALRVKAGFREAVARCAGLIDEAAAMRPNHNPHGWAAVASGFTGFVKDHAAGLAQLSNVLKTVSGVAGVLSFIPVVGEAAAILAVAAAAASVGVDASLRCATGQGSWKTIAVDAALTALPGAGRITSRGLETASGIFRAGAEARAASTASRLGETVPQLGRTYENQDTYLLDVASHYGINLRGVKPVWDYELQSGVSGLTKRVEGGWTIRIHPGFVDESDLANTIAHELHHARKFQKGLTSAEPPAYASGDALGEWINGKR